MPEKVSKGKKTPVAKGKRTPVKRKVIFQHFFWEIIPRHR